MQGQIRKVKSKKEGNRKAARFSLLIVLAVVLPVFPKYRNHRQNKDYSNRQKHSVDYQRHKDTSPTNVRYAVQFQRQQR